MRKSEPIESAVRRMKVPMTIAAFIVMGTVGLVRAIHAHNTTDGIGGVLMFFVVGPFIVFLWSRLSKP